MIRSLFDTDFYKLTMQYAVLCKYPGVKVRYEFINRRPTDVLTENVFDALHEMLDQACENHPSEKISYLKKHCSYFPQWYLNWLLNFKPKKEHLQISDGKIVVEGPWEETIWWEVPILATISEAFCTEKDRLQGKPMVGLASGYEEIQKTARKKINFLNESECKFIEMGTRRRRSYMAQAEFMTVAKDEGKPGFLGTSNVHLACHYNLKPVGTMAHEWIMGISALESLRHANRFALRQWYDVFKGQIGIALTDTFGTDAFLKDFDHDLARKFDGVRQDSGNAFHFADKMIAHYKSLGIDPTSKTLIFSDGLNGESASKLQFEYGNQIRVVFGIGTHFTNDFVGRESMNIVMKMTHCNGIPVVKLSDVPGKASGDPDAKRVALWTHYNTSLS